MLRVAIQMLFGDRTKYLTLVLGLAFATMLINQQASIFLGLLIRSTGILQNISQPDLWVTDPSTRFIVEYRALADRKLDRVRSVPGVAWAEPLFTNLGIVELNNGRFQRVQIIGLPRSSLIGRPPEMTKGHIDDLRAPDAVVVEESSREKLDGVQVGEVLKLNDARAIVVGYCRAKKGFDSNAVIYTTYDNALKFTPTGSKAISYILVKVQDPARLEEVRASINAIDGAAAFTRNEFALRTIDYILKDTGIGINFGITIVLGFFVGLLLSAAIFYQFTIENLRNFAVLKAMGTHTRTLAAMVIAQALIVGIIGFGIGLGIAAIFTLMLRNANAELDTLLPWQLVAGSFVAIIVCIVLASLLSLWRVVRVPPGVVFSS
ncbi:MAG: ABC transporter permease [Planctomycetota bacterium]|nr:ABC transporter permease [Planctomycetota bacterium]